MIKYIFIYFATVSVITAVITVIDKYCAIKNKRRIPEDFLMTLGLIGGAAAEYVIMKIIRHKTRHKKFMLGLPAQIIFHIIIIVLITVGNENFNNSL